MGGIQRYQVMLIRTVRREGEREREREREVVSEVNICEEK